MFNVAMTPGQAIQTELERRGWTQEDLAKVMNRSRQNVNDIIAGRSEVTAETAKALSEALGQTPEYWWSLEGNRQFGLLPTDDGSISKHARLLELGPVKEMQKRGWIAPTSSVHDLERELCKFYGINSAEEEPRIAVATRRTDGSMPLSPQQRAWCYRAANMARSLRVAEFAPERVEDLSSKLKALATHPELVRRIPSVLASFGVRYVVVEPLQNSKIDGAAFWLADRSPVIAMSARFDRIDAFWFTLFHELSHIRHRDEVSVDSDLVGEASTPPEGKSDIERRADAEAAAMLVAPEVLQSFIVRVGPIYSSERIVQFAHRVRVHPGVVVGQLQFRGEIPWSRFRNMLSKIRDFVIAEALTDGWGHSVPVL